jgi:hypothetical protein
LRRTITEAAICIPEAPLRRIAQQGLFRMLAMTTGGHSTSWHTSPWFYQSGGKRGRTAMCTSRRPAPRVLLRRPCIGWMMVATRRVDVPKMTTWECMYKQLWLRLLHGVVQMTGRLAYRPKDARASNQGHMLTPRVRVMTWACACARRASSYPRCVVVPVADAIATLCGRAVRRRRARRVRRQARRQAGRQA